MRKVELELPDLEAVWAEVSVKSKKFLVGSVYIRNNSVRDIRLFQQQMSTICQKYAHIVIGMDANAHHPLWDDLCVGNRSHTSLSMGEILLQTAEENDMHIHNSGVPTFYQSGRTTAPDVTLTKGMSMYGNISWSLSSRTLGSNHEPILLRIGDQNPSPPRIVIDWPNFDWDSYKEQTKLHFDAVLEKWKSSLPDLKEMSSTIVGVFTKSVEEVGTTRTLSAHSRPWISPEISKELKELRVLRLKLTKRRTPLNHRRYVAHLDRTINRIKEAEDKWIIQECEKMSKLQGRAKWKVIDKITNQSTHEDIQPIRYKDENGDTKYAFEDQEILNLMETHYIRKPSIPRDNSTPFKDAVENMLTQARSLPAIGNSSPSLMYDELQIEEVRGTFSKNKGAPGSDRVSR